MPTGFVTRFNDTAKAGFIETKSGNYPVSADDMDPATQFEGAHVDFDVSRAGDRDHAVNVTLREGTRHEAGQSRFGDTG